MYISADQIQPQTCDLGAAIESMGPRQGIILFAVLGVFASDGSTKAGSEMVWRLWRTTNSSGHGPSPLSVVMTSDWGVAQQYSVLCTRSCEGGGEVPGGPGLGREV